MPPSDGADRRPGCLPQIHVEGEDLIFVFRVSIPGMGTAPRKLTLRCDRLGEVWVALRHDKDGLSKP